MTSAYEQSSVGMFFLRCFDIGSSTDPGPPPPIVVALSMPATIALYSLSSCSALSLCTRASNSGFRGGSTGLGSTTSHSDSSSWNRFPSPISLLFSKIHLTSATSSSLCELEFLSALGTSSLSFNPSKKASMDLEGLTLTLGSIVAAIVFSIFSSCRVAFPSVQTASSGRPPDGCTRRQFLCICPECRS